MTEPISMTSETPAPRRLLVAAVQTLAGPTAADHLYDLAQAQPTSFHIVVPVLRPEYGWTYFDGQAERDADQRLEMMLEFMGQLKMTATGETRPEPPREAIETVAQGPAGPFDGVIVLWHQLKFKWFYGVKGELIEHDLGIPVEAIHTHPPTKHSNIDNPEELRRAFAEWAESHGVSDSD